MYAIWEWHFLLDFFLLRTNLIFLSAKCNHYVGLNRQMYTLVDKYCSWHVPTFLAPHFYPCQLTCRPLTRLKCQGQTFQQSLRKDCPNKIVSDHGHNLLMNNNYAILNVTSCGKMTLLRL